MGHFYFYFLETEFLCVVTKHYWKKTAELSMRRDSFYVNTY